MLHWPCKICHIYMPYNSANLPKAPENISNAKPPTKT